MSNKKNYVCSREKMLDFGIITHMNIGQSISQTTSQPTTLSKTIKTLVWVGLSNALVAVLTYVTGHQEMYNTTTVSLANLGLVIVKNILDSKTPNY